FFFQAEDGIRDGHVTGVQTCALPILLPRPRRVRRQRLPFRQWISMDERVASGGARAGIAGAWREPAIEIGKVSSRDAPFHIGVRTEERRVGDETREGR